MLLQATTDMHLSIAWQILNTANIDWMGAVNDVLNLMAESETFEITDGDDEDVTYMVTWDPMQCILLGMEKTTTK